MKKSGIFQSLGTICSYKRQNQKGTCHSAPLPPTKCAPGAENFGARLQHNIEYFATSVK